MAKVIPLSEAQHKTDASWKGRVAFLNGESRENNAEYD
jgi:hypothetical protein